MGVEDGLAQFISSGVVKDPIDVVILVDDHDRQVTALGVRYRQLCALGEVSDSVAV
jgi:hypothetical protein